MKTNIRFGVAGLALAAGLGITFTLLRAQTSRPAKPQVESVVVDVGGLSARTTGVGSRRELFDGPTRTLLNLEGHISTLNPGQQSHPPHQHANEEMIVLTKGKLEVSINGNMSIANAGDIFFFASNDWHNVKSVGNVPAEYYVFNWSAQAKPGFVAPVIPRPTTGPVQN